MEAIKEDVQENKGKVTTLYETIFGSEKGPGLQAQVKSNSDFIGEIRNYVRAAVLMFMAQGVAIIIWAVSQAK